MKLIRTLLSSGCVLCLALMTTSAEAQTIFNDSFADGDVAATGANDTNWWTSSSSSGIDIAAGELGLVTGTSGRGIHTAFATQSLNNVGDMLTAEYTFTTPTTVGSGSSSAFRVGLFGDLGRNLDQQIDASSGTPNELYGWSAANGNPNGDVDGLPGYLLDHDVNTDATSDLNFREHNVGSATGRLLATTGSGSFSSFSSGPDAGYTFEPNTEYTGSIMVHRISATEIELTGVFDGNTYTLIDSDPETFDFGFLGFHANSNQFGSTNAQDVDDNGLTFSNINLVFKPAAVPEPGSLAVLMLGGLGLCFRRRR